MSETTGFGDEFAAGDDMLTVGPVPRVIVGDRQTPGSSASQRRSSAAAPLQSSRSIFLRRAAMLLLVSATLAGLLALFADILSFDGLGPLDFAILGAFVITAPWNIIGFWNAIIGLVLLWQGPTGRQLAAPHMVAGERTTPIRSRTAIVMAVRHEDIASVVARLKVMEASLAATPYAHLFDFHVLSDSARPEVIGEEERAVAEWRADSAAPRRISYRRRVDNAGFKAGNLREFCVRAGHDYDFFLPLDADSLMAGEDILRLVRIMEAHPQIGLLQSLVVGLPSNRFFTRVFQFGMRHGMRTYTTGSAWWQADCGPYWGHNALIRMQPFTESCHLPKLSGKPPLGGYVLSHDQIEAALLRRAGYECRVLPVEAASYEENPPTLPDFNMRDLRWCQGNMQYFRLLNLPKLKPASRIQVFLAILMYFGSVGWMAFTLASALIAQHALLPAWLADPIVGTASPGAAFPIGQAVGMFVLIFFMNIMPKIAGMIDVLTSRSQRRRYGGTLRVLSSFLLEFVFTLLLAPAVALTVTIFMVGLLFGKRVVWDGQNRSGHRIAWSTALNLYWPHVILGAVLTVVFWTANPIFVAWGAPVLAGLLLAPVFAVVTASDLLSTWSSRWRLCAVPEEVDPTDAVKALDQMRHGERTSVLNAA